MTVSDLINALEKLEPSSEIEVETAVGVRWGIDHIGPHEAVWADEKSYPLGVYAIYVS